VVRWPPRRSGRAYVLDPAGREGHSMRFIYWDGFSAGSPFDFAQGRLSTSLGMTVEEKRRARGNSKARGLKTAATQCKRKVAR